MKIKYLATILIGIAGLCPSARAVNTYLGGNTIGGNEYAAHYTSPSDTHLVGTVIPGLVNGLPPGQVDRDVYMTNELLHSAAGQHFGLGGSVYSNTGLAGPDATAAGALTHAQLGYDFTGQTYTGPVTIDLNAVGTFTYLVVAYDGPNSGVAVWNIAGLTGTIQFDAYGRPDGTTGDLLGSNEESQYRITGFTLLNPTGVPDGGTTVMLLGMGLGALGMVRRYLFS